MNSLTVPFAFGVWGHRGRAAADERPTERIQQRKQNGNRKKPPDFLKKWHSKPHKPLTAPKGNYITISLQRAYKANTGLFLMILKGIQGDSELDRLHVLTVWSCRRG